MKGRIAAVIIFLLGVSAALFFALHRPVSSAPPDIRPNENWLEPAPPAGTAPPVIPSDPFGPGRPFPSPPLQTATPAPTELVAAPNTVPSANGLEYTNLAPAIVLDNMRTAIRQFGSMFGGNPVGTNPEITRALHGRNPKQANFLDPAAGLRINPQGELIDPWGTPYFFHQLSGTEMEVRSAGPDKTLWTADDLLAK